jgi:hypothetical protein
MPVLPKKKAAAFLGHACRGHPEYTEMAYGRNCWQWLQDSLEGGSRYRNAIYAMNPPPAGAGAGPATDPLTRQMVPLGRQASSLPARNLLRHRRESPPAERDTAGAAAAEFTSTDDPYELRRARTPIPGFVAEAVGIHLGRIYAREVKRDAPEGHPILAFWADVDGRGSSIDDWMRETVAPQLAVLGQLDLAFDHPRAPDGEPVETKADADRLNLGGCVASVILPENLVWWKLTANGRYAECVVKEVHADPDGLSGEYYRHWSAEDSVLYKADGEAVGDATPHSFGRVPIVRVFDTRKVRCENVGQSRYEPICEIMREYYNLDSEDILANTLQAHPLLSGPEDYCSGDSISIGPNNVLPKKKATNGDAYEGWEYVGPTNDTAEKRRQKLADLRDAADRAACLTKPAGAAGTTGRTVSQSGISKMMDASSGNDWLTTLASMLERAESIVVEYALCVMADGPPDEGQVDAATVAYPREFDLRTAEDSAALLADFQALASAAGDLPLTEGRGLKRMSRLMFPGLSDEEYAEMDDEIGMFVNQKANRKSMMAEAGVGGLMDAAKAGGPGQLPPPKPGTLPSQASSTLHGGNISNIEDDLPDDE